LAKLQENPAAFQLKIGALFKRRSHGEVHALLRHQYFDAKGVNTHEESTSASYPLRPKRRSSTDFVDHSEA
jgi:hypothetical protein